MFKQDALVAYLGNSVTAQRESYVDFLHSYLVQEWQVAERPIKAGLGGVGSLACAGLLDYLVLRHLPDFCFIECSLADSMGATSRAQVEVSISSIVGDLRDAGVTPIFLHLEDPLTDLENRMAVKAIYRAVAYRFKCQWVEVEIPIEQESRIDRVHPSPICSEFIAGSILEALNSSDSSCPSTEDEVPIVQRIRCIPAKSATAKVFQSRVDRFKFTLPYVRVSHSEPLTFSANNGRLVGLYVIANDSSGVVRIASESGEEFIQIFDAWCERPRIQFIEMPADLSGARVLEVDLTHRSTARFNARGDVSPDLHIGDYLDIIGAAAEENIVTGLADSVNSDQSWWL